MFVAVGALHCLAGLLLLAAGKIRIARPRHVESPLSIVWLSQDGAPRIPVTRPTSMLPRNIRIPEPSRAIERPPGSGPQPNAITLPLDLSSAADATARRQSDKEEAERRWRNLAGPSDSQLEWSRNNTPSVRGDHQLGDDELEAGGELITWLNDKCYYTTRATTTFGMPQTTKVCKDPPKPETHLFKGMRRQLDDAAKGPVP